jgi:hypothetical protein
VGSSHATDGGVDEAGSSHATDGGVDEVGLVMLQMVV